MYSDDLNNNLPEWDLGGSNHSFQVNVCEEMFSPRVVTGVQPL